MADPPPANAPVRPRRKRRWLRRILAGLLLIGILLWLVKVPLANWILHKLPGDWEITVAGLRPGFAGVTFADVRVVHRPTGLQLAFAEEARASHGWPSLLKGKLGTLTLTNADVIWHEKFETPYVVPPEGGPPAAPVIEWDHGIIRGGTFTWYEEGHDLPRLSLRIVSFDGGKLTIYNDGRLEAAPQKIGLEEVVSREFVKNDTLTIESRSPQVQGIATAQRDLNRYTVETIHLQAPECRVAWHQPADKPPAPTAAPSASTDPPRPAWDKPVEFFIRQGTADPGRVAFTLHPPSAPAVAFDAALHALTTSDMRINGGLPFIFGKTDATLTGVKSPATTFTADEVKVTTTYDEQGRFHVSAASVNGALLTDSNRLLPVLGFTPEQIKTFVVCRGELDAQGSSLVISSAGVASTVAQQVKLRNFAATRPGEKEPIVQASDAAITAVPSEVMENKRLRSVSLDKMEVKITENVFTDELNPVKPPPVTPPPAPGAGPPGKPRWYGWNADSLTVSGGKVRGVDLGPGIPDATGSFTVATTPREPGGERFYNIHIDGIALSNPLLAALPVDGVMDIAVHPTKVWETESIDQVRVNGMNVELNEAFLKLFQSPDPSTPDNSAPPAAPRPVSTPGRPWKVNQVIIENSGIVIDDVGDGRRLAIPIRKQVFSNVPLGVSMVDHDTAHTVQKVEVPAIYLYSPFLEGVTVAELPVNFIYFTFAGLMEKRLERVELLAPKIKAGPPLFDFIEAAEKRWSRPQLLPIGEPVAVQIPSAVSLPVWDIPFYTELGSVITTLNGYEWSQIPALPFRNARVREGPDKGKPIPFRLHGEEAHGELAIEPGWYEFPEYKLRVYMSDEGRVLFNFPLKEKDNNLVEVFQNNTIIYRQLEITKVWLSVTYDKQGIYISFGGETCGGYITGKFNLYLDQTYSWDASASFTGINMKPLSAKLLREYALIDGIVDTLNVTAYGDMTGVYQTTASLSMKRSGRLHLKCLDELRSKFVKERADWKDDLARIGVDALRDFAFTSCEGSARLFGEEGQIKLLLKSRQGSRDFTVNLKDYRHRQEKALIRF